MPSYQEAFSQSPLEAMACGLPVVAFPVSGIPELLNNDNGVICKDFTPVALKEGILCILDSDFLSQTIRKDVVNRFSPKSIAQKYIITYQKLLS